jgi:hypothetical protein
MAAVAAPPLFEPLGDGTLALNFHPGQLRAWDSERRIVGVVAGSQSGKSSFGPHWLYREIQRCGPGDYLVAAPTFPLLSLKALPEFRTVFTEHLRLGWYAGTPTRVFTFSRAGQEKAFSGRYYRGTPTKVYFGHASDPESLEAMTAKAAWLDEAGQKRFRLGSWEAVQRRVAVNRGRILVTTTPYDLGWLKQRVYDPWARAGGDHPEIDVIRFDSTENPAFPPEEMQRARRDLPHWKFQQFYRGIFTRPAGLIYDCFDQARHACKRFPVPGGWPRLAGLDFGGVNTAAVFLAHDKRARKVYLYREYLAGRRTAKQHAAELLRGEPGRPAAVGGSKSEGQWRDEFAAGGLCVAPPAVTEVEVGIDRVYAAVRADELMVFDDCLGVLDELGSYSRPVNERGEPTEGIEDKEDFHRLDALRYAVGWGRSPGGGWREWGATEAVRHGPPLGDRYRLANGGRG